MATTKPSRPHGMRIDELARRARTTTRNVRAYAGRGLLPPALMKGRVAYYGDEHLARLRLIARLLERGFSLSAIQQALKAWQQGQDLEALLGLESVVTTPWVGEQRAVGLLELARLAPELAGRPDLLNRAVELEVLAKEPGGYRLLNERLLRAGRELIQAGLPVDAVLDELGPLRGRVEQIAQQFVELFKRELWAPVLSAGAPAQGLAEVADRVERMRPLAGAVVEALLVQLLDRAIAEAAAQELARAAAPPAAGSKPKPRR